MTFADKPLEITQTRKESVFINPADPTALSSFIFVLAGLLSAVKKDFSSTEFVTLCIGSDRSTGDCLGPLVGSILEELKPAGTLVFGTLARPVHALNLEETMLLIQEKHGFLPILAVDAALGQSSKVGSVEIGKGSLQPGAAVKKRIPPVGDVYVTGVINVGGLMELMVLQTTRLGVVFPLAQFIGWGIYLAAALCAF